MKTNRFKIFLFFSILLSLSLACVLTGGETEPEPAADSGDAIATAVAATQEAIQNEDLTPTDFPTVHPTVTASPVETTIDYAGVRFYFNDVLAADITADVNLAVMNEDVRWSVPDHRKFVVNDWVLADAFLPARFTIYLVADFRDINPGVGDRLDALQIMLASKPEDGEGAVVGDIFNAGQMFMSNVEYLQFQNGEGVRFLTQYGQALSPIGLPMMFYTFPGFTDDGQYYISAMLPATHPSLPHPEQVTMDQAFVDNWETYVADLEVQLNGEPDNMFMPPLALLDAMFESMTVGEP